MCVCVCVCVCKRHDIVCMRPSPKNASPTVYVLSSGVRWRVTHKFMQGRGYAKVTLSKICNRVGIESCTFRDRIDDTKFSTLSFVQGPMIASH